MQYNAIINYLIISEIVHGDHNNEYPHTWMRGSYAIDEFAGCVNSEST